MGTVEALRIVGLQAENIKRLRAVALDVSPAGGLVIIGGRNEQGKTSVLDAIWMALGGTRAVPNRPIRKGQEKAEVAVTLAGQDGKPSLIVRRTFTGSNSYLRVETADGMRPKSPQKLLDELLGSFTFDPLAFTRLSPAEQRDELLAVTGLNLDVIDAELESAEARRTDENRELKRLEAAATTAREALPPEVPAPVDTDELLAEYKAAQAEADAIKDATATLQEAKQKAEDAEGALHRAEEALSEANRAAEAAWHAVESLGEPPELEPLWARISTAQQTNEAASEAARVAEMEAEAAAQGKTARQAEKVVSATRAKRAELLASANMPVEGLGFSEGRVTFKDLPFEQAADSVKLAVSVGVGMAANPQLRILRITDGSLLDAEHLAWLQQMAEERDFQIWIERVGTADAGAIIIEDGRVRC